MALEIRGLKESEREEHSLLVHASYHEYVKRGQWDFLADPQWWLKSSRQDPYYEPAQTRVMVLDGRLVASVSNYTRDMYVDGRTAKVSCIGSVCTHPDHRRQGYFRQVLAESIQWMQREGYHWSFLFGKEEVYGGCGWTALGSFHLTAESLSVRPGYGEGLTTREATLDDAPLLTDMYQAFNEQLTGPIVRSEEYFRRRAMAHRFGPPPTYTIVERDGRPFGYFAGSEGSVSEIAWVADPEHLLAFLLRQWPGQSVQFRCCTTEMIRLLVTITHAPGYGHLSESPGRLTLQEAYKGLWRYLGDPEGRFPELSDTDGLKRFLREHEYVFWPVDSF